MRELAWRRNTHHFIVEIKVGNVWVEHGRAQLEDEAAKLTTKALREPGVSAVRTHLHEMKHECYLVSEEEADTVMHLPPKMNPTDRKQACPICKLPAPIANDGTNDWIFCGSCNRANPA